MMERRIGIWAAILFLVIAGRGCSGGQADVSAAEKARLELAKSLVSDPEMAVKDRWHSNSLSNYNISIETFKLAGRSAGQLAFRVDLSVQFDKLSRLDNGVVLMDKMENAETNVLFSSDECLVVEATQDSHTTPFNFLYQLILDGDAENPQVKQAFILGGWKRKISQHRAILDQLKSTIENPRGNKLLDILRELPILVLQVVDGESCKTYHGITKVVVNKTYEAKFLSLFGDSYTLEVAEEFEGDKHIQFKGKITSDNWNPFCGSSHTVFVAATVWEEKGIGTVELIHIIVKKADRPSRISKLVKTLRDLTLCCNK